MRDVIALVRTWNMVCLLPHPSLRVKNRCGDANWIVDIKRKAQWTLRLMLLKFDASGNDCITGSAPSMKLTDVEGPAEF